MYGMKKKPMIKKKAMAKPAMAMKKPKAKVKRPKYGM